jgi:uncharacterized protein YukE
MVISLQSNMKGEQGMSYEEFKQKWDDAGEDIKDLLRQILTMPEQQLECSQERSYSSDTVA